MCSHVPNRLTVAARRRARRLAYWNGGLWAIGNGLASTLLVVYLALELNSPGLGVGIGLILAAPNLVGALRMAAPTLIGRLGDRKQFCIGSFLASALVLAGLPLLAAPDRLGAARDSLAVLISLWCVYHLFQYLATVALWSWLADLVRLPIRGRFIGRRERWMVLGQAAGMLAAALHTWGVHAIDPGGARWVAYALPALVGVGFMLAAVIPLGSMSRADTSALGQRRAMAQAPDKIKSARRRMKWSTLLSPFRDGPFRRLLLFGCWFSLFNGITNPAVSVYPAQVLGFGLATMLALKTVMRLGQWALSPTAGRLADRLGNRPVLLASLLMVAQGPLCYFLAVPGRGWWIAVAWVVWIAYAGLNVALPNLMLTLSPEESNTPHIAVYFTVSGLCCAASTIAGGAIHDHFRDAAFVLPGGIVGGYFACLFLFGWIMRMLGAVVLLTVVEPRFTTKSTKKRSRSGRA
ncbi:MAG: hypothetical protein JW888_16945 [Pirellulales bacterium]|nr:hypothetical protein [Pirellulales bacterium]